MRKLLVFVAILLAAPLAMAESYQAGTHYIELAQPVPTRSRDKIEVLEFFAYSCGHCYNFEPTVKQWEKSLPEDVDFSPSPVVWSPLMEPHARAFYTAQALGVLDQMHPVIFAAMHVDHNRLPDEASIRKLFVKNGVNAADFNKAWKSFGVGAQVRQASSRAISAGIEGTPEMLVAGKYRISSRLTGVRTQSDMLSVASWLIQRERAASAGSAAGH